MSILYVEEGYVDFDYTQSTITIDWKTKEIFIPKFYLTHISGALYSLDTYEFKKTIDDLMDDEAGMVNDDPIKHNTVVELSGIPYARIIEVINGYTVTFEDGAYTVSLLGSNNNITDVKNVNQVSLIPNNSAGLVDNTWGNVEDTVAPTWDTTVGITEAYQNNSYINVAWGKASDQNEVRYNIYISEYNNDLFNSANLLTSEQGHFLSVSGETGGAFQNGVTYHIGVRAEDSEGNETDNTNSVSVQYVATADSGGITEPLFHDYLDSYANKDDWKASDVDMTETNALITSSKDEVIVAIEEGESNIRSTVEDIQNGNWEIVNNQMIMKSVAGIEIARFNLFDAAGNPTMRAVHKRERI